MLTVIGWIIYYWSTGGFWNAYISHFNNIFSVSIQFEIKQWIVIIVNIIILSDMLTIHINVIKFVSINAARINCAVKRMAKNIHYTCRKIKMLQNKIIAQRLQFILKYTFGTVYLFITSSAGSNKRELRVKILKLNLKIRICVASNWPLFIGYRLSVIFVYYLL